MKKILTFLLIVSIGFTSGTAFGQNQKTQEKKGGFAVGGYDNTRQEQQAPATKRSVVITEEAAPAVRSAEEAMPEPAPAVAAPAPAAKPQKEAIDNSKEKQKNKKTKSKGKSK